MTILGQPLKRFEDPKLITGKGSYVDDIQLPGMLHAYVLRSPHAHARIKSLNVSSALVLPGVLEVLTGSELAKVVPGMPERDLQGDQTIDESHPPQQPVMAVDRVCYVGQAVAIVVAEERYLARDGADLIEVDYEPLPVILDPLEALKDDSKPMHPDVDSNVVLRSWRGAGDVDAALAEADQVIQQRYLVQRLAPAPMETRGVLAHYLPQEDFLTVWSSTQEPHELKKHLTELLNRPNDKVRSIAPDAGGDFGEKGVLFPEEVAVPYLSMALGRPVK